MNDKAIQEMEVILPTILKNQADVSILQSKIIEKFNASDIGSMILWSDWNNNVVSPKAAFTEYAVNLGMEMNPATYMKGATFEAVLNAKGLKPYTNEADSVYRDWKTANS